MRIWKRAGGAALLADTIGAGRDDSALEALVLQVFSKLQSHAYPMKWLDAQEAAWSSLPEKIEDTPWGRELLQKGCTTLSYWRRVFGELAREMAQDETLARQYLPAFSAAAESMETCLSLLEEGWDAAGSAAVTFEKLKPVRGENALKVRAKLLWDQCKKDCERLRRLFSVSGEDLRADMMHMAPAMLALLRLTGAFARAYAAEKMRRNATDFSDQEHFARAISESTARPTELGRAVSARYREIMIDEFQDTNEVQNQIFAGRVAPGEKPSYGGRHEAVHLPLPPGGPYDLPAPLPARPNVRRGGGGGRSGRSCCRRISAPGRRSWTRRISSAAISCPRISARWPIPRRKHSISARPITQEKPGCETEFYLVDHQNFSGNETKEAVKCAETEARFVAGRIRALLDEPLSRPGGGRRAAAGTGGRTS